LSNLCDLYPICRDAIVLPVASYSLKEVERYVGYERSQADYGGAWSIARFVEASETRDGRLRAEVKSELLKYNREDVEATWAVFNWLRDWPESAEPSRC
jgi:uncharacterized protein